LRSASSRFPPLADLALDLVPEALGQLFDVVDRQVTFRPFGCQPLGQPLRDLADAALPLFGGHGSPSILRSARPDPSAHRASRQ